ncbi:membrane protein insertase YidC [Crenobacter cavernae]|uniref:Membrane protein insertase YidC n=1 Tax=Crenobacter cavernae TaxID=2290923 RepID=A0A345Y538_9NEIS|nr:membrane protein insertase YidC [Crenobacter cavernae]AXK39040.1 membrane protein insertase YidC [Crenobacter cavernae]
MDSKRLILFIALSLGIILLWDQYFAPKAPPVAATQPQVAQVAPQSAATPGGDAARLASGQRVKVSTDLFDAQIDTVGGDLRELKLKAFDSANDEKKPFELFTDKGGRVYVAQTGLVSTAEPALPTHKTVFSAEQTAYTLNGDSLEVRLSAPEANGVKVDKVYVFRKGSYRVDVRYDIANGSAKPLSTTAYYRLLRDGETPEGESRLTYTFTGPAVYTSEGKFQKASFEDVAKGKADYVKNADNGWVAMVQHYFVSAWLLKPEGGASVCANDKACRFELKENAGLYSAATLVDVPAIAPGAKKSLSVPLYAGPEEYNTLVKTAEGLELTKDYGWVHIFASPLFWLLTKLHALIGNWGWAIVLLTLIVKGVFYPLNAASYRSMAKMKALAPRLERLKEQFGDDRMKMQQATMEMYKVEKINPLGGCLPILVQIPVFIGLYWSLLASVELRQADWILWINDLARPDPYYVLPALMAITMYLQTFLNPPPADPVQAKMMKIMPIAFSVMFFFFASGLVLYWLVNNILSIAQQWHVNRSIERSRKAALQS